MFHHHDAGGEIEDELIAHILLCGHIRSHAIQRLQDLRGALHFQLFGLPLQRPVRQHLERDVQDDAEAADGDRSRRKVRVAALHRTHLAVGAHNGDGEEVLRMALAQVVAARRNATSESVGRIAWRHAQCEALRKDLVLQLPHLDPRLCGDLIAGTVLPLGDLDFPEGAHIHNSPTALCRASEAVEAVTRGRGAHGAVLADGALQLLERGRSLNRGAGAAS
mmetsp:Transcript_7614/g.15884  ORF Transcript_7614/g.15884 Transcript_7614/m.15884 type:complete len:221 (+) Transcript_7614:804-1466(+)